MLPVFMNLFHKFYQMRAYARKTQSDITLHLIDRMPPVVSGGIGNDYELLVCQQILIPACLDEVAAELVVEYLLGLIGLECCNNLLVGLQLVRILEVSGTRCDQVPVLLDVQPVILVDGVLGLEAEIQCVVAVYDSCGNVSQRGRDNICLELLDGDLGVVGLDVVDGRVELCAVLDLDQARSFQNLEGTAAVGYIVRNGYGVAVLKLINRLNLVGVQVQRNDKGVADVLDLIAVVVDLALQVNAVLESVQIDLAVSECVVRGNVVRELYELKVDALVSQLFLGRRPQILVDAADYAELYGYGIAGIAVGCLCIIGSCSSRRRRSGTGRGLLRTGTVR